MFSFFYSIESMFQNPKLVKVDGVRIKICYADDTAIFDKTVDVVQKSRNSVNNKYTNKHLKHKIYGDTYKRSRGAFNKVHIQTIQADE